jgi:hypothetical protein
MGIAVTAARAWSSHYDSVQAERQAQKAACPEPERLPPVPLGIPCPLDTAQEFASQILWMPGPALDALTLVAAASHVLDAWQTVPRILASSDGPQSGKTTLLDVLRMLANAAWDGTGATSYALRARFNEPESPFVIIDEISDVFGQSGRRGAGNPIGLLARHGYRRTAKISMAVDRTAEDVPAFAFMAFGGLKTAIPADIRTRAIVFKMQPCPASVRLPAASTDPEVEALARTYRANLHAYVRGVLLPKIRDIQRRFNPPHPAFRDRKDQVFRALYVTALAADEAEYERYLQTCELAKANGMPEPAEPALDWGDRALAAFKALMLDASDLPALLPAQAMLRDAAGYARQLPGGERFAFAADIKDWLLDSCPEPLWQSLTERRIEHIMAEALGESQVITAARDDGSRRRARGFPVAAITGAWDALEMSLYPPAPAAAGRHYGLFDDLPDDHGTDSETQELAGMSS